MCLLSGIALGSSPRQNMNESCTTHKIYANFASTTKNMTIIIVMLLQSICVFLLSDYRYFSKTLLFTLEYIAQIRLAVYCPATLFTRKQIYL